VFENRVLRGIFGLKRDEVTGGWRKLHDEELHNLYSSPSIIKMIRSGMIRWAGHIAHMGRRRMHIGYWWESQKEKDHQEDEDLGGWIILMDHREIGWGSMDWIDLAEGRDQWRALVNTVMKLQVPLNVGNFLNSCRTGGFSRRAQLHEVS
jgi:hypothetical protein